MCVSACMIILVSSSIYIGDGVRNQKCIPVMAARIKGNGQNEYLNKNRL